MISKVLDSIAKLLIKKGNSPLKESSMKANIKESKSSAEPKKPPKPMTNGGDKKMAVKKIAEKNTTTKAKKTATKKSEPKAKKVAKETSKKRS
jgi:hypothetical protein